MKRKPGSIEENLIVDQWHKERAWNKHVDYGEENHVDEKIKV